jgi:hypothetical protein
VRASLRLARARNDRKHTPTRLPRRIDRAAAPPGGGHSRSGTFTFIGPLPTHLSSVPHGAAPDSPPCKTRLIHAQLMRCDVQRTGRKGGQASPTATSVEMSFYRGRLTSRVSKGHWARAAPPAPFGPPHMRSVARLQSSRCAIVTGDGVSVLLTERRPSAASVRFDGAKLMTRLTDLLDPDQWLASGNKLSDFPLPRGASEREAVRLILLAKPELDARLERWFEACNGTWRRRYQKDRRRLY